MVHWNISATTPDPDTIHAVVQMIRKGGVIAFPTSTLYGLGADANNSRAVESIFDIKGRQSHHPLLVLIKDKAMLPELVRETPPQAVLLMEAFWPGGITMVLHAGKQVSRRLTGNTGKIGVRVPKHPVAAAIVAQLAGPMTGTSANLSGRGGCSDISCLEEQVSAKLDGVVDAGPLKGGRGSTVIDMTIDPPQILREGTISEHQIRSVL
jgi:L-threonylcarbamoyladenylate synthase